MRPNFENFDHQCPKSTETYPTKKNLSAILAQEELPCAGLEWVVSSFRFTTKKKSCSALSSSSNAFAQRYYTHATQAKRHAKFIHICLAEGNQPTFTGVNNRAAWRTTASQVPITNWAHEWPFSGFRTDAKALREQASPLIVLSLEKTIRTRQWPV